MAHINLNDGLWGNTSPIVVFFGQTSCGKTTALIRLIKYLSGKNYKYDLCPQFHDHYYPNYDYREIDAFFASQLDREIQKVESTSAFSLCNIYEKSPNGRDIPVCRFLESPGENLFPVSTTPSLADALRVGNGNVLKYQYLLDILNTEDYKKIWVFFMDPDFIDIHSAHMPSYVNDIQTIASSLKRNDNIVFLVDKEDEVRMKLERKFGRRLSQVIPNDEAYINEFFNSILKDAPFTTQNFFGMDRKHFRVVPFRSFDTIIRGLDSEGNQLPTLYQESDSSYPKILWKTIQDAIMNRF